MPHHNGIPDKMTYKIRYADGLAFRVLNYDSTVEIDRTEHTVTFRNTNLRTTRQEDLECHFDIENGDNLVIRIPNEVFEVGDDKPTRPGEHALIRAVISQWHAPPVSAGNEDRAKSQVFFGEIFVGDPDGTGGFGGYGGGG